MPARRADSSAPNRQELPTRNPLALALPPFTALLLGLMNGALNEFLGPALGHSAGGFVIGMLVGQSIVVAVVATIVRRRAPVTMSAFVGVALYSLAACVHFLFTSGALAAIAISVLPGLVAFAIQLAIINWICPAQSRRFTSGKCQQCGFDLTGNLSGRCPECGAENLQREASTANDSTA